MKPAAISQGFTAENLTQRTLERRAVEAVIWGTPAVNFDRMYQAMVHDAKAGEGSNKIVYWSRLFRLEEPDPHAEPRLDLLHALLQHEGRRSRRARDPAGRQAAPSLAPSTTAGRRAIEDVGPAGVDKGKGGKYLILPARLQRQDSIRLHPACRLYNYQGYALLRSILKSNSEADVANSRRLRQADQALPALPGGSSA